VAKRGEKTRAKDDNNDDLRVAEVGVSLRRVLNTSGRKAERVDGPGKVRVPVDLPQRKTLADGGLVNLDGKDAGLLEVDDLVAERERELLALDFAGDVGAGEGPVEDGDRAGEHTLKQVGREDELVCDGR
jgi:hypothetical protein